MRIIWDEPKRVLTLAERGLDFADLTPGFFESALVRSAKLGRRIAIGRLGALTVAVVYQPMGTEAVSVISMRRASRKERGLL